MPPNMDVDRLVVALDALGAELARLRHPAVEAMLVGGAAGALAGLLDSVRITEDCDAAFYLPDASKLRVETAARKVAKELELGDEWFNSRVMLWKAAYPPRLIERREFFRRFGPMTISLPHREDLIAMKLLASREDDVDDLDYLSPTLTELNYAATWIELLPSIDPDSTKADIEKAMKTIEVYRERATG